MTIVLLAAIVLGMLTSPAGAATLREFAKIPGATWTNSAWTADGKRLHSCTASRSDAGRQTIFTRDRAGYSLTLTSVDPGTRRARSVRIIAGKTFDERRTMRATGAGGVKISLGKTDVPVNRLTQAVYRKQAAVLELRLPGRTLTVPLDDADGALVELGTCWRNARPG